MPGKLVRNENNQISWNQAFVIWEDKLKLANLWKKKFSKLVTFQVCLPKQKKKRKNCFYVWSWLREKRKCWKLFCKRSTLGSSSLKWPQIVCEPPITERIRDRSRANIHRNKLKEFYDQWNKGGGVTQRPIRERVFNASVEAWELFRKNFLTTCAGELKLTVVVSDGARWVKLPAYCLQCCSPALDKQAAVYRSVYWQRGGKAAAAAMVAAVTVAVAATSRVVEEVLLRGRFSHLSFESSH